MTMTTRHELTWVLCTCTQPETEHYNFDDGILITFDSIDTWPIDAHSHHSTITQSEILYLKPLKEKETANAKEGRQ